MSYRSRGRLIHPLDTKPIPFGSESLKKVTAAYLKLLQTRSEREWKRLGERRALALFHEAAKRVPAYKHFLKKHRVDPAHIRTIRDFERVPPTDKKNYIAAYPLAERSWYGALTAHKLLAASSGTSGAPTLWPRGADQEREAAIVHDALFTRLFSVDRRSTLMVIGFPMGIYVSGIATAIPLFAVSLAHQGCSIATVGNNKQALLDTVRALSPQFEQTILIGHPFFIKDAVETGKRAGINWARLNVRTLHCSEGFNEPWRDYLSRLLGRAGDDGVWSTYGSSEFLLMAYETPETVRIRRRAAADSSFRQRLFGSPEVPNLFQYNPSLRYFETYRGDLLATAYMAAPLIRFNQHDAGMIFFHDSVREAGARARREPLWQLPFLALWGRSDRTLVFHAANIYPEHVQFALNKPAFLAKLTGKFVLEKRHGARLDPRLYVVIELREGIRKTATLERQIAVHVREHLLALNMEYRDASSRLVGKDLAPHVELRRYQDPAYFKAGLKPQYIARA